MNIRPEFEQEKDGSWVAKIPGVRDVVGYGWTRHEAAVGLTVSALHVLADRVKTGQLEVEEAEDEPVGIFLASRADDLLALYFRALMHGLEGGHTPPESFLSGWADYEAGRVVDMDRALEEEPPLPAA
jgi:hypothetical protein